MIIRRIDLYTPYRCIYAAVLQQPYRCIYAATSPLRPAGGEYTSIRRIYVYTACIYRYTYVYVQGAEDLTRFAAAVAVVPDNTPGWLAVKRKTVALIGDLVQEDQDSPVSPCVGVGVGVCGCGCVCVRERV